VKPAPQVSTQDGVELDDNNDDDPLHADAEAVDADDDDDEYNARPVTAALDAGLFTLLPTTSADSYLDQLFGGGGNASEEKAPPVANAPPAKATPERVFRLLATDDTSMPTESAAASVRKEAPPVAGVRSQTLVKQLQRTTRKQRLQAEKKKAVDSSKIATPMRMADMAGLLAAGQKKQNKRK
jgi:hypothetical protein